MSEKVKVKVIKTGNSLSIRIPFRAARALHLQEGDEVMMTLEGSSLLIQNGKASRTDLLRDEIRLLGKYIEEEE